MNSNWEVIGMRKVGMAKQVACQECGYNQPGIYYDWKDTQTEDTKILCDTCHEVEKLMQYG